MLFTFHTRKHITCLEGTITTLTACLKETAMQGDAWKKDVKWGVDWWVVWSIGHDLSLLGPKWRVQVSTIQLGIVEHKADDIWYISVVFGCWVFYVCWYYTLQCAQEKLAKLKSSCQPKFGFLVDTNRICEMIEMRAQTLLMIDLSIYIYIYYTCVASTGVDDIPTPIQSNLNTILCMTNIFWIITSSLVLCCHFITSCHVATMNSQDLGLKFKQNRSKSPTPTHPIQMLAETLQRTTTKLRDTATSWFKLQTPFVESFLFTLDKNILCIYSNHSPLPLNKTHRSPASLESPDRLVVLCRQSPRPSRSLEAKSVVLLEKTVVSEGTLIMAGIESRKKNWVV